MAHYIALVTAGLLLGLMFDVGMIIFLSTVATCSYFLFLLNYGVGRAICEATWALISLQVGYMLGISTLWGLTFGSSNSDGSSNAK